MVAREGSAPSTSGCRPDVILFHHRAGRSSTCQNCLPGLESHQHSRLQRAMSYELDDPAINWPAKPKHGVRLPTYVGPLSLYRATARSLRPSRCSGRRLVARQGNAPCINLRKIEKGNKMNRAWKSACLFVAVGLIYIGWGASQGQAAAGSMHGAAGQMPAIYDGELFTVNM